MPNVTTTPAAAASAAAAAKVKAAKAAAKALRQVNNQNTAKYFAVGMAGIMALFILFHWTRFFFKRYGSKQASNSKALGLPLAFTRIVRKVLVRGVPGFVSVGHVLVFLAFTATVLSVTLGIDWDRSQLQFFGHRLGWVTAANLVFVIFLSLKNTPLAILTAYSYEKLNFFHQVAGYSLIACTMSHTVVMLVAWGRKNNLSEFLLIKNINGIVAGCAMLVILASATLLRKLQYETFHIIHITMAALILITSGMHRPDIPMVGKIVIIAASLWIADRALRIGKLALYNFGNTATVTNLPHGGTRIVLKKTPIGATPGTHCFLWIPRVRATESHPFTVLSTDPFEMVVAAYDGFTKDLHAHAAQSPGRVLKASVDGPYGTVPNFILYDKVVFIAGGSGASFTCGVAVDVLRRLGESSRTTIEFVWVVKEHERVEWFARELKELMASPCVSLRIHSTLPLSPPPTENYESNSPRLEKKSPAYEVNSTSLGGSESDVEKQPAKAISLLGSLVVHQGRPDISTLIKEVITGSNRQDKVIVAVCGPGSMMEDTRAAVADNIKVNGPSLELHSEHFGW